MDRKGIFSYLAITFGLTWAIEVPLPSGRSSQDQPLGVSR